MIGWLLWQWRKRKDWSRPCGCSFKHERDGSTMYCQCLDHWLD